MCGMNREACRFSSRLGSCPAWVAPGVAQVGTEAAVPAVLLRWVIAIFGACCGDSNCETFGMKNWKRESGDQPPGRVDQPPQGSARLFPRARPQSKESVT